MKKLFTLLFAISLKFSHAQLFVGAAYGTFNNPGSAFKFRGMGPTLMIEYSNDEEVEYYLNASLYKKTINSYSETSYDENGLVIGNESITETYKYKYLQMGFKRSLAGDFSDSRFNLFAGGGGALGFVSTQYKYEIPGNDVSTEKVNYLIYGFNFNSGMQWRLNPVTLELKGNLDFSLKPVVASNADGYLGTYVFTSLRLGVLVPIIK
jgi:hypothetical protein